MKWSIELNDLALGGFAPAWYKETYPSYGNKNQAGAITNIDLMNPGYIMPGRTPSALTNGTEAAGITTLLKGMTDSPAHPLLSNTFFGVGGAKLNKFTSTTVTNAGDWPHTIDKGAVTGEDGEDVCVYGDYLYYSYNHSGAAGDIGRYDLSSTFDDDWGSTVPATGKGNLSSYATISYPHQMIVGGNDIMYISNGQYVASYNKSTDAMALQALDLPAWCIITSIAWSNDRLYMAANRPGLLATSDKTISSIFTWDGTTDSWESEIRVGGTVGALFVKNGVVFVFYQDKTFSGGYKLGYVNGNNITELANFTGSLPAFYQVTGYKDFIIWASAGVLWAFGSGDTNLPIRLFQFNDGGYSTVGGLVAPYGTSGVFIASTQSTSYQLAAFSDNSYLDATSAWKSLNFDVTGYGRRSYLDAVRINFPVLTTGNVVDWYLVDNNGTTIYSDKISYSKLGAVSTAYYPFNGKVVDNLRIEFYWTNQPAMSTGAKIRNIKIMGHAE